ncbi:unnamed protein product [Danaus chrysippus]|uniref:(African queen) hypothetical protein n=1 Tax=Danaus chrysippus TaxID=151541 RepID=A0A8J2VRN2_9NEOP|nr:unnamed protein product [Danaus chrysippus]
MRSRGGAADRPRDLSRRAARPARARRPRPASRAARGRGSQDTRTNRKRSDQRGGCEAGERAHARRLMPTLVTLKIRLLLVSPFFFATSELSRPLRSVRFFCRFCKI